MDPNTPTYEPTPTHLTPTHTTEPTVLAPGYASAPTSLVPGHTGVPASLVPGCASAPTSPVPGHTTGPAGNPTAARTSRAERQARAEWLITEFRRLATHADNPYDQARYRRTADSLIRLASAARP
ncbi:hypothetical protein [Kribbella solani]|uniref:Uncharacterized protein n=1 Tax=Kribbella solani TaxID=236067 RepID=A0A841E3T7_9ACTN|nr:hypothetical protein [Kribbella solani]MBB5982008.1 hypothetical protein [Kribbella solani]